VALDPEAVHGRARLLEPLQYPHDVQHGVAIRRVAFGAAERLVDEELRAGGEGRACLDAGRRCPRTRRLCKELHRNPPADESR
jgi:hypothetical protein